MARKLRITNIIKKNPSSIFNRRMPPKSLLKEEMLNKKKEEKIRKNKF